MIGVRGRITANPDITRFWGYFRIVHNTPTIGRVSGNGPQLQFKERQNAPMPRIARTPALSAALFVVASLSACGPTNFYVQGLKVDGEQHLIPIGTKSLKHPDVVSYYMFFYTATKLTIVNHFAKQAGSDGVRELLFLEADRGPLERTVKTDQVVTGPFGAVVAQRTCFYNRPDPSSFEVLIQSSDPEIGREIPDTIPELPTDAPRLTSISLVRIFRTSSRLIFGVGNYEADGELGSIDSGQIENEGVVPGASIMMKTAPGFDNIRQTFGLPSRVPVGDYLLLRRMHLQKISNPEERTLAVLGYGFGKFIREDSLQDGVVASSRYLRPIVTEEEGILGPECDARFRQQQSAGRPTVQ